MTLAPDWTRNGRCRRSWFSAFPGVRRPVHGAGVSSGSQWGGGGRVWGGVIAESPSLSRDTVGNPDKSSYYEIQVGRRQRRRLLVVNCSWKLMERLEDMLQGI